MCLEWGRKRVRPARSSLFAMFQGEKLVRQEIATFPALRRVGNTDDGKTNVQFLGRAAHLKLAGPTRESRILSKCHTSRLDTLCRNVASKAQLKNSKHNMCLVGAKFREKNDDAGRNFFSHWRPIPGRMRIKNTTINHQTSFFFVNIFMHISGVCLCNSGSIGRLWLSWCHFSSAALFRLLKHRLIVLNYIFSCNNSPMKLKLSHVSSSAVASASLENAHVLPCKCVAVRSGGHHGELRSGEKMDERRSFRRPSRARQCERS